MKSDSLKTSKLQLISLEDLHQQSQNWQSTLAFWKDEIRFMHNLINKNFVYFFSNDQKGSLDALVNKISEIEETRLNSLKSEVVNHEKNLSDHMKYNTDLDMQNFRSEHAAISKHFDLFLTNYRLIKRELFRLAENALKEKDIKRLVS